MKKVRKFFWFVPTILWMVLIFQFSGQQGEVSGGVSLELTEGFARILHSTVMGDRSVEELTEILHPLIRKAAHMTEYAILFVLLFLSFRQLLSSPASMAVSILTAFVYACTDEIHQVFVNGRSGNFQDVCVDMTGVLAAVMIVLFLYSSRQPRRPGPEAVKMNDMEKEV